MRRIIQRGTTGTAPGYDLDEDVDPAAGSAGGPGDAKRGARGS
jgi:hypothetical protein